MPSFWQADLEIGVSMTPCSISSQNIKAGRHLLNLRLSASSAENPVLPQMTQMCADKKA